MSVPNIVLNNGKKIPIIGLGTWRSSPDVVTQAVKDAIDVGYRHIDCAHVYCNEKEVGVALKEKISEGVIKREDIFITSKLWNTHHHPSIVRQACLTTLTNLQLDFLDNYLIHWPMGYKEGDDLHPKDDKGNIIFSNVDFIDTWHAMEELVDAGLCHSIGISNFNKQQIERILSVARIPPSVLQIECHPFLDQSSLIKFCQANGIAITAYSALGSSHTPYAKPGEYSLMKHPIILSIAKEYDKNPAQILLRYQIQRGNIVIPRSINKEHMSSNLNAASFELKDSEMQIIDNLNFNGRFLTMPMTAGHPYYPFENQEISEMETTKNI